MDGLTIHEAAETTGWSPRMLRYLETVGLVEAARTSSGYRKFGPEQLQRLRTLKELLEEFECGLSDVAFAKRLREDQELSDALDGFDEPRAQAILDALVAAATLESILSEVVLPYLHDLGARWESGTASVAQEHFASNVLRGRLLALARGWGRGVGPLALVGCLPGERHELGLIAFALALRARGWRIAYLGADTPLDTVGEAARSLAPALIVLVSSTREGVEESADPLRVLAEHHRIALAGTGARDVAAPPGVIVLTGDPVAEAERVTTIVGDESASP